MVIPSPPEDNEAMADLNGREPVSSDPDRLFSYRKSWRFFAQIGEGLEETGAGELTELGASDPVPAFRGMHFGADFQTLCRINYQTRLCSRVLAPLISFDCHSTKYLYKIARQLPWEGLLGPDGTMAVTATVAHSAINHSKYAALCLKDALADHYTELYGRRPNVDRDNPDLQLNLHIDRNRAVISLDTSGSSLHRRGYRQESVAAPMQETLAAAIIRLSGWDGSRPLVDPFCGSGTLLCEALMQQARIPAGYLRKRFGFELLPDFQRSAWEKERRRLDGLITEVAPGLISGFDLDRTAVKASRANLGQLPGGREVRVARSDFRDLEGLENTVIVANPPYGLRMGDPEGSADLLKEFGDFLKQRCLGAEAYLYFGRREMLKQIGLRPAWKKPLKNGGLDGVLAKYLLY